MRVIVCGSRDWGDRHAIDDRLMLLPLESTIIVGYNPRTQQPRGADRLAYVAALKLGLAVETYPADWEQHGKSAGFIRNSEMAATGADLCIAFWDGASPGTGNMIETAKRRGIPVEIVRGSRS